MNLASISPSISVICSEMVGTKSSINWEMERSPRFGWRKISHLGEISLTPYSGFLMLTSVWGLRGHGYVAIKIVPANLSEARVLKYLMRCPQDYPGSTNVMKLLDHFTVHTSNGLYDGLVLEVMSENTFKVNRRSSHGRLSLENGRVASRQVAMGLDYLHKCGIGHGG